MLKKYPRNGILKFNNMTMQKFFQRKKWIYMEYMKRKFNMFERESKKDEIIYEFGNYLFTLQWEVLL